MGRTCREALRASRQRTYWSEADGGCQKSGLEEALQELCELRTCPPQSVYLPLLKSCYQRKDSALAKKLYDLIRDYPSTLTGVLADHLVITLVKCGDLENGLHVFHSLPERSAFVWTSVISGLSEYGRGQEALEIHQHMRVQGVEPNHYTYVSLLKACGDIPCLKEGQKLHVEVEQKGLDSDIYVASSLVSMYGKCGSLKDAENVFFQLPLRSIVTWNGMLSAYVQQGKGEKALQLYRYMIKEGVSPNTVTLAIVLQACGGFADKEEPIAVSNKLIKVVAFSIGQGLHSVARKTGITEDISNALVSLYGKCMSVAEAENVFCVSSRHSAGTWNSMLSAYSESGEAKLALQLCCHMQHVGVSPDEWTFVGALHAGANIAEEEEKAIKGGDLTKPVSLDVGKALHSDAERKGFTSHVYVKNSLLTMYSKCGCIAETRSVFVGLPLPNLASWNAVLTAFADNGQEYSAFYLFRQMQEEREWPNEQTFTIAIHACSSLATKELARSVKESELVGLKVGRAIHSDARRRGVTSSVFVGNTLVSMYGKCGKIAEAEHVFQGLSQWNNISWNAMLSTYVDNNKGEMALRLYAHMQREGVNGSVLNFRTVLLACGILADKGESMLGEVHSSTKGLALKVAHALHADAIRMGLDKDVSIVTTFMTLFSKCETVVNAAAMFDTLCEKNILSYNAMLSMYVQHGLGEKALQLYRQIPNHRVADDVTIFCVLQACSGLGHLKECTELHFILISAGLNVSSAVSTSLIHTYGFCATMADAETVFHGEVQPDVVSWSACVAGYAREGNQSATYRMFQDMEVAGIEPNQISFLSLLHACSHAGLIFEGVKCFEAMLQEFTEQLDSKCYAGLIDLLGRAGDFKRVMDVLMKRISGREDLPIWLCVLGVCCIHGNMELGRQAFDYAVSFQPDGVSSYISMANISACAELLKPPDKFSDA